MSQSCKTCRFMHVTPTASGRRIVRKDAAYRCEVEIPEAKLPDAVTKAYGFRWPPHRSHVFAEQGTSCPLYQQLEK